MILAEYADILVASPVWGRKMNGQWSLRQIGSRQNIAFLG
jgi:hypothetical protein